MKIKDVVDEKISNTSELGKKDYNTEITDIENKICSITGLDTTVVLNIKATEIEKKNPDITNSVQRLLLVQKPGRLKTKSLIPQVLLLLVDVIYKQKSV